MLLSDYVLKLLEQKKIKNVFMITGGAIAFIVDAFSRNKKIKYTCVAHEQAAAMMADAYSRVGPNLGATMVTSGPGATNLITGIACSWFDSVPTIHISGQVNQHELSGHDKNTSKVRQVGFQETDIVSIVKSITKYAATIKNPKNIGTRKIEASRTFRKSKFEREFKVINLIGISKSKYEGNLNIGI